MFWLAGCDDVWHAGYPNGDCWRSFSGVLKVCVPKWTGLICVLVVLISLSLKQILENYVNILDFVFIILG